MKLGIKGSELLTQLFSFKTFGLPVSKPDNQPLPDWKKKSRENKPAKMPARDERNSNSSHGGVFGGKLNIMRHLPRMIQAAKRRSAVLPTQHQRVVIGRAARMGLSIKEYETKYSSTEAK